MYTCSFWYSHIYPYGPSEASREDGRHWIENVPNHYHNRTHKQVANWLKNIAKNDCIAGAGARETRNGDIIDGDGQAGSRIDVGVLCGECDCDSSVGAYLGE